MFKASLLSMLSLVALIGCGDETPATESPKQTEPAVAEKPAPKAKVDPPKAGSRAVDGRSGSKFTRHTSMVLER